MKSRTRNILGVAVWMTVVLLPSHASAHEPSPTGQVPAVKGEPPGKTPGLGEIVPLAANLRGRLATLESKIKEGPDVPSLERNYEEIQARVRDHAGELDKLKDSKDYKYSRLVVLREAIKQDHERFDRISKPVSQAIRQLEGWREEWLAEKRRWNEWQSSLIREGELDQLKSAFGNANEITNTALNLILPQLSAMLEVQGKAGTIDAKLEVLIAELDVMIFQQRRSALLDESPPMISLQFLSQFRSSELWYRVQAGLDEISWPGSRFFAQNGWIILLQGFISLVLIILAHRNRTSLHQTQRWRFIAIRPFSAGLFLGFMATSWIYQYENAPVVWKLINMIIAGVSFARLIGPLIEEPWKRHFVYGLTVVTIVTRLMGVVNFPLPLFRFYIVVTALVAIFFCLRWAKESIGNKESSFYAWSLRSLSTLLAVIIMFQLWGKRTAASNLFVSLIDSMATVLVIILFLYMIRGGLEWLFRTAPFRRTPVLQRDPDFLIRRVSRFVGIIVWGFLFLPAMLMIWGVYDNLEEATKGLLALGFNTGSQRISVGLLLVAAAFVYGSFLLSWFLQNLLIDEVFVRRGVERGIRVSIGRLIHYFLIFLGFLFALSALGLEITKLTIILSALGVGIGFGLQGVVNNFVSGLILLFERPVRVGDYIEMGGTWSEIKKIGLRATTVQTFDQADVIIPNADLVSNQVTNWTLSNRGARLIIPVGVAYGSDVPLVIETLLACANANEMVAKTPAPHVLFLRFGESSLDFELRVWVLDVDHRLTTQSELLQEIDRRFREADIEIAFPQRDLHLRSVDESAALRPQRTAE